MMKILESRIGTKRTVEIDVIPALVWFMVISKFIGANNANSHKRKELELRTL